MTKQEIEEEHSCSFDAGEGGCSACTKWGRIKERKKILGIIDRFDFNKIKEKYKPNMDLVKLIKSELKKELENERQLAN